MNKKTGTTKEYKTDDLILPMLKLPDPCPVKVEVDDKYIRLYVGPRDWQWMLKDGTLVGAGTRSRGGVP